MWRWASAPGPHFVFFLGQLTVKRPDSLARESANRRVSRRPRSALAFRSGGRWGVATELNRLVRYRFRLTREGASPRWNRVLVGPPRSWEALWPFRYRRVARPPAIGGGGHPRRPSGSGPNFVARARSPVLFCPGVERSATGGQPPDLPGLGRSGPESRFPGVSSLPAGWVPATGMGVGSGPIGQCLSSAPPTGNAVPPWRDRPSRWQPERFAAPRRHVGGVGHAIAAPDIRRSPWHDGPGGMRAISVQPGQRFSLA